MNMKITPEKLTKARATAERLQLEGRELLYLDDDYIIKSCNGIGPEVFPSWLRDAVTIKYRDFFVPSLIHDLRWQKERESFSWDGIFERHLPKFNESNDEFRRNCLKVANDYGWYNPLRYIRRNQAWWLFKMLAGFGYHIYLVSADLKVFFAKVQVFFPAAEASGAHSMASRL